MIVVNPLISLDIDISLHCQPPMSMHLGLPGKGISPL
jgi:hypothetical protein